MQNQNLSVSLLQFHHVFLCLIPYTSTAMQHFSIICYLSCQPHLSLLILDSFQSKKHCLTDLWTISSTTSWLFHAYLTNSHAKYSLARSYCSIYWQLPKHNVYTSPLNFVTKIHSDTFHSMCIIPRLGCQWKQQQWHLRRQVLGTRPSLRCCWEPFPMTNCETKPEHSHTHTHLHLHHVSDS